MASDSVDIDLTGESDRGCVLLGAAMLEERLEKKFRDAFGTRGLSKNLQDSLFEANAPLATFSGKIKLAYAFGLICERTFRDLESVRRLRNIAAHVAEEFDFTEDRVGVHRGSRGLENIWRGASHQIFGGDKRAERRE